MNKYAEKEISIDQYYGGLINYVNDEYYWHSRYCRIIATTLATLIERFKGKDGSNQPDEEKLKSVQDICDEYVKAKFKGTPNNNEIIVEDIPNMPRKLLRSLVKVAKEPSEREQRIRKNIEKLRDK